MAAGLFIGVDDFQHAVAASCAEVEGADAFGAVQPAQRAEVGVGEVADVEVVAHAGAVGCRVVAAEYPDVGLPAGRHLGNIGHQVVGDAIGVLADPPAGVGADRVEVAQDGDFPLRVGVGDVA